MRFYKRDPDRALAGMAGMTLEERGAYNTILDMLYSRDGVVPDDDEMLRRVMGCHGNKWRAVKARLIAIGKIWIEDGFVRARGVEETIAEAAENSETARNNVAKRWDSARRNTGKDTETIEKQARNRRETLEKDARNLGKTEQNQRSADTIQREYIREKEHTIVCSKKPRRIPHDWHLSAKLRDFALSQGMSEAEAEWEADQFRDHWGAASGKGATALDWDRKWYTWVRNAVKWARDRKAKVNGRDRAQDRFSRLMAMADRIDRGGAADCEMDYSEGGGDVVALLPAGGVGGCRSNGDGGLAGGSRRHSAGGDRGRDNGTGLLFGSLEADSGRNPRAGLGPSGAAEAGAEGVAAIGGCTRGTGTAT